MPFTAGGTADIFARMVGDHLGKVTGQVIVPENIGGGGGTLALGRLARSEADGTTVALASTSNLSIHPTLLKDRIQYQTLRDLAPITQISLVPNLLVVNPERIKARTVQELIDHLKANPEKITFGSSGVGTTQHLAGELFMQRTGTKMTHVAYKGSSQMMPDLIAGQIDLAFDNAPLLWPHIKSGKLIALGTATAERLTVAPELPAIAETVPGFKAVAWHGFLAPVKTPKALVDAYAKTINEFMQRPETQKRFDELGVLPMHTSPEAFAKLIADEAAQWSKVIETAGVKPE
ncbi:Bug family tripartite tricarboxylate transporter substrate binding protein [Chenggangzhangella methanolivorans]|uniref:Bug family tripartite tricarboxylate transporter substrate binding protein n=1 Tax=Chenggangzhangella methanolivorans TaxID=1437009 RepID=UPI0021BD7572|nr:tripartite tricarboxylate transporter substrate-binding protein [Chenggangzhangella methanolivorans]